MPQKTSEVKKSATKKHRPPAAMTAAKHHRAGHHRQPGASPQSAGTSGIAYTSSEFGTSKASTDGDGKAKERERGRQRKGDQQRATRQFIADEHPTAHLDRPINVPPNGMPYFTKFTGTGAGQHATA